MIGEGKRCRDCEHFQTLGVTPTNAELFYVLSLAHTHRRDGVLLWYGSRNCDYYFRLEWAGKYTAKDLPSYGIYGLHNGERSIAIPCEAVEAIAVSAAEASAAGCRGLDEPNDSHPGTDRVVLWSKLRELRETFGQEAKRRAAYKRGIRVGRREGEKPKVANPFRDVIPALAWTRGVWDGAKQARGGGLHP
jgi:hypothetical protein